ncbi:hypothetical protein [Streptomyces scabiei]|uniref:hypothetical protein n=1 Tax=Streptomyces scabiei TaxID=1930 RepID=UPI0029B4F4BD|nr:hypothetical protein [Streptomyces scabiei]MDX2802711.1 hypothetical protein [Streptomyces scabiei]
MGRSTPENEKQAEQAATTIRDGLLFLLKENLLPVTNEIQAVTYFADKAEEHLSASDAEGYYEHERHRAAADLAVAYAALAKATARALAFPLEIANE